MMQEIELLASIAVVLPFAALFAYHLALSESSLASGLASGAAQLRAAAVAQQEADAYGLAGLGGIPAARLSAADPTLPMGATSAGRLVRIGDTTYIIGVSNETQGTGND